MKTCTRCKQEKPCSEFGIDRSKPDGQSYYCKPCITEKGRAWRQAHPESVRAKTRAWHAANPEKVAASQRKIRYGILPEEYAALLDSQSGLCAACGQQEKLVVDHDHGTGAVRGLLCSPCNLAIGIAKDDPSRLARMAQYLLNTNLVTLKGSVA